MCENFPNTTNECCFLGKLNQRSLNKDVRLSWTKFNSDCFNILDISISILLKDAGLTHACRKRQVEFCAGRLLVRLAANIECLPRSSCGAPIWPLGRNGAISHARQCVVLIEGTDQRYLGVDVEVVLSPIRVSMIKQRILTEKEQRWLKNMPTALQIQILTLIFSAKEAAFKALSSDLLGKPCFNAAEIFPISIRSVGRWKLLIKQPLGCRIPKGYIVNGVYVWQMDQVLTFVNQTRWGTSKNPE